jgi:limonene 1,2-monooxygenase
MAPFHWLGENPTLALDRDMELIEWLDELGFDEAWVGEHHSAGWETIASPEIFLGAVAQRTKHIKLGTGVLSLPYHHPLMAANRMLQLDHMTKGRVMMGVGPGALVGDAYMLGIDPPTQRSRMDEALGIILRLWTETEPITYESEWFTLKEARVHLRPYSQPHMPVAVAASQSPAGMISAGKHGAAVLSLNTVRLPGAVAPDLAKFWQIAEDTAAEHGKVVNRNDWGLVLHVHLAESRKEAIEQARVASGLYQREYFEDTLGLPRAIDGPADKIIDYMVETDNWCVGTPDDLVTHIKRLDEESGGFGRLLVQATEWGTREQVLHSYELMARYVMPKFQGSLKSLESSVAWTMDKRSELVSLQNKAMDRAKEDYLASKPAP